MAVVAEHGNVVGTGCGGGRNWERDGNPEACLVGAAMGTLNLRCWRASGTRREL